MIVPPRACLAALLAACAFASTLRGAEPIDRHALVSRHNVVHRTAAPEHFLQVGNGEFAYAFDITGMQTLDRTFPHPIPLNTMSNWGWHSFPNTGDFKYEQTLSEFKVGDRTVTYADKQDGPAGGYFRANPHRVNLARIGLWWEGQSEDGATAADVADFTEIEQTLDLWTGTATSKFKFRGKDVTVTTAAHPNRDAVAFRIESKLIAAGKLGVTLRFSYPLGKWGPGADDFTKSASDEILENVAEDKSSVFAQHIMDDSNYCVRIQSSPPLKNNFADHAQRFTWPNADGAEIAFEFADGKTPVSDTNDPHALDKLIAEWDNRLAYSGVVAAAAEHWSAFWSSGGALDLSGTDDPRAKEIERRVVLSQYLTAIQNGSLPPQETGLLTNSWFGKQHLEMYWWHAAHFALWGRPEFIEKSMAWYQKILPQAQAIAKRQGYAGARWPKMCGPNGVSSPSGVGEFLAWQQPHVIAMAELVYRDKTTLELKGQALANYSMLVDETAKFMADFVEWDADGKTCHLGPPLIPSQENYRPRVTRDPTYELAYWHYALSTAQAWRERQGQPRNADWDRVIAALPKPTIRDGRYAAVAVEPFTNTADHPSMLCALGVLPKTPLVDPETMLATAKWVEQDGVWNWKSTWGWDYPVIAMTYARCGDHERAVNALLRDAPKNKYLPNGHNYQEERLPIYLPGNGGVLAAAALMAAGWDGGPTTSAPGFPADWHVRFEGLRPSP
jgi:hypothetical protein